MARIKKSDIIESVFEEDNFYIRCSLLSSNSLVTSLVFNKQDWVVDIAECDANGVQQVRYCFNLDNNPDYGELLDIAQLDLLELPYWVTLRQTPQLY